MLQTADAMHALLLPPQQRLRRTGGGGRSRVGVEGGGVGGGGGGGWGGWGVMKKKKEEEDRDTRVATSPARLQVNQLPVLGDKLMKYAASNWTLVNQGVEGGKTVRDGGWG